MQISGMAAKIAEGDGFIAALDQSGGSTPKALRDYGIADWADEAEMFALIHQMRVRILTAPAFTAGKVIGAILFERTMDGLVGDTPVPQYLTGHGIVPFVKIDRGLETAAKGVRLMQPIPNLDPLLERARGLGVFGTKARSVIDHADRDGIAAIVTQQFALAEQVLAHGLTPIIEPETTLASPDRAEAEKLLRTELEQALERLPGSAQVMLKLSLPVQPGCYDALVDHPRVLRVVALSGGYSRTQACAELAQNRGMIASFSRALLAELRADMSDAAFNAALDAAIEEIYQASTRK